MPLLKLSTAIVIATGVGLHFARILLQPELDPYPFAFRAEYLMPAGLLYILAHCLWGWFWVRLLRNQGVGVTFWEGLRAYFVSQFGKYIPGKVWVIGIRVGMLRGYGSQPGSREDQRRNWLPVLVTSTYETLTSMAAGAIVAATLLPWVGVLPDAVARNTGFVLVIGALPLALGALNRVVARRLAIRRGPDAPALPSPPLGLLAQGLLLAVGGWCLLGVSLGLVVQAVAQDPPDWNQDAALCDFGAVALSYIAGFVVLFAPGGLGVRELVLEYALRPRFEPALGLTLADAQAVVVALILRLTWTVAEVAFAVALYVWGPRRSAATD